jgi:trehalose-6-phosphate synthase
VEIFRTLPWREEILDGLLATDSAAFHIPGYRENFCRLAVELKGARVHRPDEGEVELVRHDNGATLAAALPIGVDVEDFERLAASAEVQSRVRKIHKAHGGRHILFGADRLDYTKGIRERLLALDRFLTRNPAAKGKVSMLQVVVPSRHKVLEYRNLKQEIDREVGRINGQHGRSGWVPIHYQFNAMDRTELAAHYLAARAALVTPLKDGMNLVAPEYVATRTDERGVLVLSEFAGVSRIMDGALRINPYDIDSLSNSIGRALTMPSMEQAMRMRSMRRRVRANTISAWTDRCLELEVPVRRPARMPRPADVVRSIPRDLTAQV